MAKLPGAATSGAADGDADEAAARMQATGSQLYIAVQVCMGDMECCPHHTHVLVHLLQLSLFSG